MKLIIQIPCRNVSVGMGTMRTWTPNPLHLIEEGEVIRTGAGPAGAPGSTGGRPGGQAAVPESPAPDPTTAGR